MKILRVYLAIILQDFTSILFLFAAIYIQADFLFWKAAVYVADITSASSMNMLPHSFYTPLLLYYPLPVGIDIAAANIIYAIFSAIPLIVLSALSIYFKDKYLGNAEALRSNSFPFLVLFCRIFVVVLFVAVTFSLLPFAPRSMLYHYLWTTLFWFNYVVIITSPIWSVWIANSLTRLLKLNKVSVIDYYGGIKL